jgi:hypothetical protein
MRHRLLQSELIERGTHVTEAAREAEKVEGSVAGEAVRVARAEVTEAAWEAGREPPALQTPSVSTRVS